jgi:hypothetical protein
MNEVRGVLTVVVQKNYRKPTDPAGTTWSKVVTIHKEMHVTMSQAEEILARWKDCNPDAMGSFQAALY